MRNLLLVTIASLAATTAFPAQSATLNGAPATDDRSRSRMILPGRSFSRADKDEDDVISPEELRTLLEDIMPTESLLNDEHVKSVFNTLDGNKDQRIGYEDVDDMYQSLQLPYMFMALDMDNNGQFSLNESMKALKGNMGTLEELDEEFYAAWSKLFKSFDKNNDEEISLDEVKDVVKDIILEVIQTIDTDGDDKVSLEELQRITDPKTLPDIYMMLIDKDGDGQYSYDEFRSDWEDEDPIGSMASHYFYLLPAHLLNLTDRERDDHRCGSEHRFDDGTPGTCSKGRHCSDFGWCNQDIGLRLWRALRALHRVDAALEETSRDEVKDVVNDIIQEAIQKVIRAVDTDGDGKVSLEELQRITGPEKLPDILMMSVMTAATSG